MRKVLTLLGVMAIAAVGCGGGSSTSTSGATSSPASGNASAPVSLPGQTNNKGTKTASGNSIDVEMDDYYFEPTFIQGTPGQSLTVHLKNEGKNVHTFTSASLNVDETLQPDQSMDVQVTLPQSGATEFHCNFHQNMGMQGAFFFHTGDTVGGAGAAPAPTSGTTGTTATTSNNGGYNYGN